MNGNRPLAAALAALVLVLVLLCAFVTLYPLELK